MKNSSLTLILPILLVIAFSSPCFAISLSSGSYSTSFDCIGYEDPLHDVGDCLDFVSMESNNSSLCGESTEMQTVGNNPAGSGKAMRIVVGDGKNIYTYSGGFKWSPGVSEIWIRYYIKYELGFAWSGNNIGYDKIIYLRAEPYASSSSPSPIFEWYGIDGIRMYLSTGSAVDTGVGWQTMMGGPTSDGQWHSMEFHLKSDTNGTNGEYQAWIDGVQVAEHTNLNFNGKDWDWFILYSNANSPSNTGGCGEVWIDDVSIYSTTPPNTDADGDPFIGLIDGAAATPPPVPPPMPPPVENVLFEETFETADLSARGWYDNANPVLTTAEAVPGSTRSLEFMFNSGATNPVNGGAMRKKFTASDSVYVRYYVKYSNNWVGSQRSYHPHEFQLMTNKNGDWTGMAYTYLTAYVEQNALQPRLVIQDGRNVDLNNLNVNLVNTTENRSVAGCNGDSDGHGDGSCYSAGGGQYWNDKHWMVSNPSITPGIWHKVEAHFKLNSIINGKGVADGVLQYWLDDQLLINHSNVMFRTNQHADMQFNQFIIAPYIGDGSPVQQTFWVDDLVLATTPPSGSTVIQPPSGFRLIQEN